MTSSVEIPNSPATSCTRNLLNLFLLCTQRAKLTQLRAIP